eukprot:766710-Hanusia_phi.AAC.11
MRAVAPHPRTGRDGGPFPVEGSPVKSLSPMEAICEERQGRGGEGRRRKSKRVTARRKLKMEMTNLYETCIIDMKRSSEDWRGEGGEKHKQRILDGKLHP